MYTAMAGIHGCIPNFVEDFNTFDDAVETVSQLHELDEELHNRLHNSGYLELDVLFYGNEYIEIIENNGEPEE